MIRSDEIELGMQVFHIRYGESIESGKVLAIKKQLSGRDVNVCIEKSDSFEVVESGKLFATYQEAVLHRAMELQQEASGKLNTAARLFKEAGVMKSTDD